MSTSGGRAPHAPVMWLHNLSSSHSPACILSQTDQMFTGPGLSWHCSSLSCIRPLRPLTPKASAAVRLTKPVRLHKPASSMCRLAKTRHKTQLSQPDPGFLMLCWAGVPGTFTAKLPMCPCSVIVAALWQQMKLEVLLLAVRSSQL